MTAPAISRTEPRGPDGAPLLVLGCSLGTSSLLWEQSARLLAKHFRVSVWDLPGHGASPPTTVPFSLADLADAVADSYDEDFMYAGVSIAGGVGLELALRHPGRVVGVVTVCSAARFASAQSWHERARVVRTSGTGALIVTLAQRWFAPGTMEREPDVTGRLLHALRDADDETYALCCDALAEFDARDRLGSIEVPIVAAYGTLDIVTPEAASTEIARLVPGARSVEIEGASHLAPADRPRETAAIVSEALRHFE